MLKYFCILLCMIFILACSDDDKHNNNSAVNTNEEAPVIFTPVKDTDLGVMDKNSKKNIQINFLNPRNEDVTILIPNIEKDWHYFNIDTKYDKCKAKSQCVVKLTSIIKDYAPVGNNFGYISFTLLNNNEFKYFLKLNNEQNTQSALKYLTNRIYVKSKFIVNIK